MARAEAFGRDGQTILTAAWAAGAPPHLRALRQVEILRQVWLHQFYWDADGGLRWREGSALPPAALRFDLPYDTDAHYCVKRDVARSGYRVHLTETCDQGAPHFLVHVATTIAPVQDGQLTEVIHDDQAARRLAPAEHVVDTAYLTPAQVERAQRAHGITLLGPIAADHSHQAKAGQGFDEAAFTIDWDARQATCPQGSVSRAWRPLHIGGHDYIQIQFAQRDCSACPARSQCTDSADRPRALALLPHRSLHELQTRNRLEQRPPQWQQRYAIRAGIEATLSQTVRTCGLRRSRYRGLDRTHVQHVLTAMACNFTRLADWFGTTPTAPRRDSHFRTLCTSAGHTTA